MTEYQQLMNHAEDADISDTSLICDGNDDTIEMAHEKRSNPQKWFIRGIAVCSLITIIVLWSTLYRSDFSSISIKQPVATSNVNAYLNTSRYEYPSQCKSVCHWNASAASFFSAEDDFLCPSNFRNLADYTWFWPWEHFGEANKFEHPSFDASVGHCLPPAAIVYHQTSAGCDKQFKCDENSGCRRLFDPSVAFTDKPVILITGQSDYAASQFCPAVLEPKYQANPNTNRLVHWYAQNNDRPGTSGISSLPIGLNCFEHGDAMRRALINQYINHTINKCYHSNAAFTESQQIMINAAIRQQLSNSASSKGELYELLRLDEYEPNDLIRQMNANLSQRQPTTQSLPSLLQPLSTFKSTRKPDSRCRSLPFPELLRSAPLIQSDPNIRNALEVNATGSGKLALINFGATHSRRDQVRTALCNDKTKSWLTCFSKQFDNAVNGHPLLANTYAEHSQYLYWFSPRGNGIDCHRTWEAMYLGSIPVLERSSLDADLFHDGDLPILLVDDMTKLTKADLLAHLPRFLNIQQHFRRTPLLMSYWKAKILRRQFEFTQKQSNSSAVLAIADNSQLLDLSRPTIRCWGSKSASTLL